MDKLEAVTRITEAAIQGGVIKLSKSNSSLSDDVHRANDFNIERVLDFIEAVSGKIEEIK